MEYKIDQHLNRKVIIMKLANPFIFIVALIVGCQSQTEKQSIPAVVVKKHFPNTLANKKFLTQGLIGLTTEKSDYLLNDSAVTVGWVGNTVRFVDSLHFVSAYVAWCGNDCFTRVYGRYYFVDSLKVSFYTDSITRSGECEAPTEYTKSRPPLDLYLVKTPEGRIQLNHKVNKVASHQSGSR